MNNNGQGNQNQGQRPVRPQMNNSQGQRPVRPNIQNGQGQQPVRPNMQANPGGPVRPNMQGGGGQRPIRPNLQGNSQGQQSVRPRPMGGNGQGQSQQERGPMLPLSGNYYQNRSSNNKKGMTSPENLPPVGTEDEEFQELNSELVNDTVAENKKRGKKAKVKKEKKQLTPEQKKKIKISLIVAVIILVIAVVASRIASLINEDSSKHIKVAGGNKTSEQPIEESSEAIGNSDELESQDTEPVETDTPLISSTDITTRECSQSNPLGLNEYTSVDLVVNTKTANDKNYANHDAKIYTRLSTVAIGYDAVMEYINEYNDYIIAESSKKDSTEKRSTFSLPSKDKFYEQSNGTDIVVYEVEVLYPSDYPTTASEGLVYKIPKAEFSIFGTVTDIDSDDIEGDPSQYIVVEDTIYGLPSLIDISMIGTITKEGVQFEIGKPLKFQYIATSVPMGSNADVYEMQFKLYIDKEDTIPLQTIFFEGQQIGEAPVPNKVTAPSEPEESTENSEENSEESKEGNE